MGHVIHLTTPGRAHTARKWAALVLCILFIAGTLLATGITLAHIGHRHARHEVDNGCVICMRLNAAENLLKFFLGTIVAVVVVCAYLTPACSAPPPTNARAISFTPVQLNVRLNN